MSFNSAAYFREYQVWAHSTARTPLSQEGLFSEARLRFELALMRSTGSQRCRAASKLVDLETRRLWLSVRSNERQVTDLNTTPRALPISACDTLTEYMGDLALALRGGRSPAAFLTYAQADFLLAYVYARRAIALDGADGSAEQWLLKVRHHLDSSPRMLNVSLVTGVDFVEFRNSGMSQRFRDFLAQDSEIPSTLTGNSRVLQMYEVAKSEFQNVMYINGRAWTTASNEDEPSGIEPAKNHGAAEDSSE